MKRTFLFIAFAAITLVSAMAHGQQQVIPLPDCSITFSIEASTTRSAIFDNRQAACTTWHLTYQSTGFTVVSIELQKAPDSGGQPGAWATWTDLASGALPLTATTQSQITAYKYQPWVSVKTNALTGTGIIKGMAVGWRPARTADSSGQPGLQNVTLTSLGDPCAFSAKLSKPINLTANAVLIAGVASKKTYICSLNMVVGAATNVAIVEGTGATCGTNTIGTNLSGGATAATGWNFAANGGIAQGSGVGSIGHTTVAADDLCILVSAANQVSGGIEYVQQ